MFLRRVVPELPAPIHQCRSGGLFGGSVCMYERERTGHWGVFLPYLFGFYLLLELLFVSESLPVGMIFKVPTH